MVVDMSDVTIFAPAPILTVTIEEHPSGEEVHVHAGGQGVWQARMLRRLGVEVTMCCVLSGETGKILRHLLADEGLEVVAVEREARGAAYVHDRRGGDRHEIVEEAGDPLTRHDVDELYSMVLREALGSRVAILSGPASETTLPADTYERLAADLHHGDVTVLVDLAGERLEAAVRGGVDVLKVSHEELLEDGLIDEASVPAMMAAMRDLRQRGAEAVIVSRASDPLLFLDGEGFLEVRVPEFQVVDTRGAGDSLTAGVAAAIARGAAPRDAVTLGAAAGALNATRRGLGTGDAGAIERVREMVTVRVLSDEGADSSAAALDPQRA